MHHSTCLPQELVRGPGAVGVVDPLRRALLDRGQRSAAVAIAQWV